MNVNDAVETRRSNRAFLAKPVPPEILKEIFRSAFRAPSWGNTQPGKVTVVGGEIFQTMIKEFVQEASTGNQFY